MFCGCGGFRFSVRIIYDLRSPNLRDLLVSAKLSFNSTNPYPKLPSGSYRCGKNCATCPFISDGLTNYTFFSTGETRSIKSNLTCETKNLIYMIRFLLIGSKQRLSNFTVNPTANINQFPIKRVSTVKSLGVHIDENLTWECHINELSKKIASGISAIKRIRYSVPYKTLLSIYNSLVQPHLDYCSSVWGSCSKSLSQKLQKLQNRAARVITFSNYDRNTDELLRMVNWVKLDRQRLVDKSIMMYKIVNNMVPEYLSSHFVLRSDTLTYNLRDSDGTLAIPQPRTNYCKRSLSYSGVVLWNSLPLNTRQSLSLNEFKSKLKNYDFDSGLI